MDSNHNLSQDVFQAMGTKIPRLRSSLPNTAYCKTTVPLFRISLKVHLFASRKEYGHASEETCLSMSTQKNRL